MLSGISHDLRTPLTRIKLQLSLIKDKNISKKLSQNVDEMEKMLSEYLQFSSTSFSDKSEKFDISNLINLTIKKYEKKNILSEVIGNFYFTGRKNLIQRCFENIINNSLKYAKTVKIKQEKNKNNLIYLIEDDGPGIPESEHENVFKPFYKIDKSRSDSKSSVGLGLSISSDIIRSHGGYIYLSTSEMGGLKVKISLPI
jgi:Signal transduction histidine kinase